MRSFYCFIFFTFIFFALIRAVWFLIEVSLLRNCCCDTSDQYFPSYLKCRPSIVELVADKNSKRILVEVQHCVWCLIKELCRVCASQPFLFCFFIFIIWCSTFHFLFASLSLSLSPLKCCSYTVIQECLVIISSKAITKASKFIVTSTKSFDVINRLSSIKWMPIADG